MSEHDFLPPGRSDAAGTASGPEPTAGALLRQARQAQGVHLAALAASLKVPVEKLEALEQDRFDLLLDAVFTRALASGVCRLLKLDPNPILQRLPSLETTKVVPQNRGLNEPFRSHSGMGSSWGSQLSKPVVFGGLALLLGAAVLVFLPVIHKETPAEKPATGSLPAGTPSTVHETVTNSAPGGSSAPVVSPAPPSESLSSVAGSAPPSPSVTAAPPVTAVPPAAAASPASAPAGEPPPGNAGDATASLITFSAKDTSWVKVTDAKGTIVLARALRAGESTSVSGTLPLSVLVGKAHAVQVQVRGQAFDLKALAKNDVARFEVK